LKGDDCLAIEETGRGGQTRKKKRGEGKSFRGIRKGGGGEERRPAP